MPRRRGRDPPGAAACRRFQIFSQAKSETIMNNLYVSTTAGSTQNGSFADPYASLAQAVSAVPGGQGASYRINVESGIYSIGNEGVTVGGALNGLTIIGNSATLTEPSTVSTPLFNLIDAYDVTVSGMTFAAGSIGTEIFGGGANTLTADDFLANNIGAYLLETSGNALGGSVTGSGDGYLNSAMAGISLNDASNTTITRALVGGTSQASNAGGAGEAGIWMSGANNTTISLSEVIGTAGDAIMVDNTQAFGATTSLTVTTSVFTSDGTLSGAWADFYVLGNNAADPGGMNFVNNYVYQTSTYDLTATLSGAVDTIITGNTVDITTGGTTWLSLTGGSLDVAAPNTII